MIATGSQFASLPDGCHLLFIYNDYTGKLLEAYAPDEYVYDSGMYIKKSEINIHILEDEKTRTTMRGDYSFEQEVKYGTLLYDKNGNVEKLRKKLLEEGTNDIDYWKGMCEFEPPVQYKKRVKI